MKEFRNGDGVLGGDAVKLEESMRKNLPKLPHGLFLPFWFKDLGAFSPFYFSLHLHSLPNPCWSYVPCITKIKNLKNIISKPYIITQIIKHEKTTCWSHSGNTSCPNLWLPLMPLLFLSLQMCVHNLNGLGSTVAVSSSSNLRLRLPPVSQRHPLFHNLDDRVADWIGLVASSPCPTVPSTRLKIPSL
jgi:hypothetical protein